jgi:hypothetical protein
LRSCKRCLTEHSITPAIQEPIQIFHEKEIVLYRCDECHDP